MNFLIIADPIEKLKPKTDTGLSLLREALFRGHEVRWATGEDLLLWEGRVWVRSQKVESCAPGALHHIQQERELEIINSFDGVWIRKDPPFDQSYLSLCWLLALEENNVPILNSPSKLLRYHEKMLPFEAQEAGHISPAEILPTFLPTGRQFNVPKDFPRAECVLKPWLGFGGNGVEKISTPQTPSPLTMLQPFQTNIHTKGDRRVFFLNGECVGHFVRFPAEGKIAANLAQGGTALMRPLSAHEEELCVRIGVFLKEIGITLAGVDLISECVSEINITAPTGFETLISLGGARLAPKFLDYAESLI